MTDEEKLGHAKKVLFRKPPGISQMPTVPYGARDPIGDLHTALSSVLDVSTSHQKWRKKAEVVLFVVGSGFGAMLCFAIFEASLILALLYHLMQQHG